MGFVFEQISHTTLNTGRLQVADVLAEDPGAFCCTEDSVPEKCLWKSVLCAPCCCLPFWLLTVHWAANALFPSSGPGSSMFGLQSFAVVGFTVLRC